MRGTSLGWGAPIAAASALLLFLFTFLDWYGATVEGEVPGGSMLSGDLGSFNAWQSFDVIDFYLFLVCVLAVAFAAVKASGMSPRARAIPPDLLVAITGGVAVLLIVYRMLDPAPDSDSSFGPVTIDVTLEVGIFLALLAAIGITAGGYLATRERAGTPLAGAAGPDAPGNRPGGGG